MKRKQRLTSLSLTLAAASFVSQQALASVLVPLPGTSDPWLAGMPDGTTANFNDSAPGQSPVEVTGLGFAPGDVLVFSAVGAVSNGGCCPAVGPDGSGTITSHNPGAEHGIADVVAPLNAVMGVFLDASQPDTSAAPAGLDFSGGGVGTDFAVLSPQLKQVFFIGDGLRLNLDAQGFVVPAGATRLFLGTMDGFEWNNNTGDFRVTVDIKSVVPETSTTLAGIALSSLVLVGSLKRIGRNRNV